jgi:hypothetical protein
MAKTRADDQEIETMMADVAAQVKKILKDKDPSPSKMNAVKLAMAYVSLKKNINSKQQGAWYNEDDLDDNKETGGNNDDE